MTYDDAGWYFAEHDEDDLEVPDRPTDDEWASLPVLDMDAFRAALARRRFPIGEPD
jgi:hypothetical protein